MMHLVFLQEQYVFLHDVVLESLLCGNTELLCETFSKELNDLKKMDPETGKSGLELQFEVINGYQLSTFFTV